MTKFPRRQFAAPDAYARQQANEAFMDVQDPAARNWRTAHFGAVDASGSHGGRMPNESPWAGYFDVLADRGAQLNPNVDEVAPRFAAGSTGTPASLQALQGIGTAPAGGGWASFKGGNTMTAEEANRPRINQPITAEETNRPRVGPRPYIPGSR
jgi:hypothetical protein